MCKKYRCAALQLQGLQLPFAFVENLHCFCAKAAREIKEGVFFVVNFFFARQSRLTNIYELLFICYSLMIFKTACRLCSGTEFKKKSSDI